MRRKRLVSVLLACMLLFSCSFIPAAAAGTPGSNTVMPRVAGRLDHSFPANLTTLITQPFTLTKGDTIKYDCTYTPKSASLDFGIIDSDGMFHYLNCTTGSINKSIKVNQTGEYTLAIRNNASYDVTVTGTVKY